MEDFELVQSEWSDPHLYWRKKIDSLKPGETKTFSYSIKIKMLSLETRLGVLSVLVDGIPVAASNDIILYSEMEVVTTPTPSPKPPPTKIPVLFLIIFATVVVLVLVILIALKSRKRA